MGEEGRDWGFAGGEFAWKLEVEGPKGGESGAVLIEAVVARVQQRPGHLHPRPPDRDHRRWPVS